MRSCWMTIIIMGINWEKWNIKPSPSAGGSGSSSANIRAETRPPTSVCRAAWRWQLVTHTGADLSGDSETRDNEIHFAPHFPRGAVISGRHSGQKQAEVEFILSSNIYLNMEVSR